MTEAYLVKHKLKPGTGKKEWLDWSHELTRRAPEVQFTRRNEGVPWEACFLSEEEDSVYYFMEVEDLKKGSVGLEKSRIPIDRDHEKVKASAFVGEVHLKKLFEPRNK